MGETVRLFVGIELSRAWTDRLAAEADRLRPALGRGVRWVRPDLYHVTVVFLGEQPAEAVAPIDAALQATTAEAAPFRLQLLDLRRLGGHERGALVAGVHDLSEALQALRARLDGELRERGIPFDGKRLVPHITLGRPKAGAGPLPVSRANLGDAPPLTVREVTLIRSTLLPGGPRYAPISRHPLVTSGSSDGGAGPAAR